MNISKELDQELAKMIKNLLGSVNNSFSFKYTSYYDPEDPESLSLDSNSVKTYNFKDFNIRYTFHPEQPNLCFLQFNNVPIEFKVVKVQIGPTRYGPKHSIIKVYIDLKKIKIVDQILLENHHGLHLSGYTINQKGPRTLILKFDQY